MVPPGVEVGEYAFFGCSKIRIGTVLDDAYFPAEWGGTVPDHAFKHRLDVVKVELPPRIKRIEFEAFYRCYCMTYLERGQRPYLPLDFFQQLRRSMPERLLLVQARDEQGAPVAAALCLIGSDCLYGRWWGSEVHADCLHFEVCYYQGLEFCLQRGLKRFDPGTQGEHKISRGFAAYATGSLHWLMHPGLQEAVAEAVVHHWQPL